MANLLIRKRTLQFKEYPGHFGRRGFKIHASIQRINEVRAITLRAVDAIAVKTGKHEIDIGALGYQKLLGTGKATQKLHVKADMVTESARAKIEAAGGKVTSPEVEANEV